MVVGRWSLHVLLTFGHNWPTMAYWLLIVIVFLMAILFFGYRRYTFHHAKLSQKVNNRISVEFKRSQNETSQQTNPSKSFIPTPINGTTSDPPTSTPQQLTSYLRNRPQSRTSLVGYISPNSMYGYMPKTNIVTNKPKEFKREFTVKLSSLPAINRNHANLNSPNSSKPVRLLSGNAGGNQQTTLQPLSPLSNVHSPAATKRPISASDNFEEIAAKKLKNHLPEDIYLDDDDGELFEDSLEDNFVLANNAIKRSTLTLDENQLVTPQRIKNNEILSSYSSSAGHTNHLLKKRKFSPEEGTNVQVKKRTYIEELELLTSDKSPYYQNIFNSRLDATSKNDSDSKSTKTNTRVNSQLEKTSFSKKEPTATDRNEDLQNPKSVPPIADVNKDDNKDTAPTPTPTPTPTSASAMDTEVISVDQPKHESIENDTEQRFYPLPAHIFSTKDHEYDRKKTKNRLDRFLASVQQANECIQLDNDEEKSSTDVSKDSEVKSETISSSVVK